MERSSVKEVASICTVRHRSRERQVTRVTKQLVLKQCFDKCSLRALVSASPRDMWAFRSDIFIFQIAGPLTGTATVSYLYVIMGGQLLPPPSSCLSLGSPSGPGVRGRLVFTGLASSQTSQARDLHSCSHSISLESAGWDESRT